MAEPVKVCDRKNCSSLALPGEDKCGSHKAEQIRKFTKYNERKQAGQCPDCGDQLPEGWQKRKCQDCCLRDAVKAKASRNRYPKGSERDCVDCGENFTLTLIGQRRCKNCDVLSKSRKAEQAELEPQGQQQQQQQHLDKKAKTGESSTSVTSYQEDHQASAGSSTQADVGKATAAMALEEEPQAPQPAQLIFPVLPSPQMAAAAAPPPQPSHSELEWNFLMAELNMHPSWGASAEPVVSQHTFAVPFLQFPQQQQNFLPLLSPASAMTA